MTVTSMLCLDPTSGSNFARNFTICSLGAWNPSHLIISLGFEAGIRKMEPSVSRLMGATHSAKRDAVEKSNLLERETSSVTLGPGSVDSLSRNKLVVPLLWMSKSINRVLHPCRLSCRATFSANVVLPTPPFPLVTVSIFIFRRLLEEKLQSA